MSYSRATKLGDVACRLGLLASFSCLVSAGCNLDDDGSDLILSSALDGSTAVLESSPSDGEQDVAVNEVVSVRFDGVVRAATVSPSSFLVRCEGERVVGSVAASGSLARFIPAGPFPAGARCEVELTRDILDVSGQPIRTFRFTFHTFVEDSLEIVERFPAPGERFVDSRLRVEVTFNHSLAESQVSLRPIRLEWSGNEVAGAFEIDRRVLRLIPNSPLESEGWHRVVIDGAVEDDRGNRLGGERAWWFRVGVPPCVTQTSPEPGSLAVPNAKISASFTESPDSKSVTADTFYLIDVSRSQKVEAVVSLQGRIAELEPMSGRLRANTTYEVCIEPSIKGYGGHSLCDGYRWRFETIGADEFGSVRLYVFSDSDSGGVVTGLELGDQGALSHLAGSPFESQGQNRVHGHVDNALVDPSGRFLFVTNELDPSISVFDIEGTGELKPIPGSPFSVNCYPAALAVHPSGRWLYVGYASGTCLQSLDVFRVKRNGALEPVSGDTESRLFDLVDVEVDPTGRRLVASQNGQLRLEVFSIAADGSLTPTGYLRNPDAWSSSSIALNSSASLVFYPDSRLNGGVRVFRIDAGGKLREHEGSPFEGGHARSPRVARLSANGTTLFVLNAGSDDVSVFDVELNGALLPVPGSPFRTNEQERNWFPAALSVSRDGRTLFLTNVSTVDYAQTVSLLQADEDGRLTPIGVPFPIDSRGRVGSIVVRER